MICETTHPEQNTFYDDPTRHPIHVTNMLGAMTLLRNHGNVRPILVNTPKYRVETVGVTYWKTMNIRKTYLIFLTLPPCANNNINSVLSAFTLIYSKSIIQQKMSSRQLRNCCKEQLTLVVNQTSCLWTPTKQTTCIVKQRPINY